MKSLIAFTMCLVGTAGLAEAYGSISQTTISAMLIIIGGILLYRGNRDEKENSKHPANDSNVLDRLYFLCNR